MTEPLEGDLPRLRRGVGAVYLAAGVLHWAEMALALSAAFHKLPFAIPAPLWSRLFFGHFLLLILGGSLYLAVSYFRSGLFTYLALVDYIVGIPVFMIGFPLLFGYVAGGGPWPLAFVPGAFLVAYGWGLRRGRAMGFCRIAA